MAVPCARGDPDHLNGEYLRTADDCCHEARHGTDAARCSSSTSWPICTATSRSSAARRRSTSTRTTCVPSASRSCRTRASCGCSALRSSSALVGHVYSRLLPVEQGATAPARRAMPSAAEQRGLALEGHALGWCRTAGVPCVPPARSSPSQDQLQRRGERRLHRRQPVPASWSPASSCGGSSWSTSSRSSRSACTCGTGCGAPRRPWAGRLTRRPGARAKSVAVAIAAVVTVGFALPPLFILFGVVK